MDYTLLGVKFNVINVILCVALGFLICAMIGYNNNNIIEGAKRNSGPKRLRAKKWPNENPILAYKDDHDMAYNTILLPPQPYKGKGVGKPKPWLLSYTKKRFDR